jgi:hypothetical protein
MLIAGRVLKLKSRTVDHADFDTGHIGLDASDIVGIDQAGGLLVAEFHQHLSSFGFLT